MDNQELSEEIELAAKRAGKIMLAAENIENASENKEGHGNFVTQYDRKVQEFLFTELHRILPEANFVGEEEGAEFFHEEYRKGYAFVIDPIDGTTNFIKAYRPSVTSIGLMKDGKPFLGIIYNPYQDILFSAVRGQGAFKNHKQIHTSRERLADCLISMGTAPYYEELSRRSFELARLYLQRSVDIRRSGSAAWDLCQVACGVTGLFFELHLGLWDFCAGSVIVEEAGGKMTDISGNPLTYDGPSSIIAASEGVCQEDYIIRI